MPISCPAWTPHSIKAAAAGTPTRLTYSASSGHYTYGWQTNAAWAGQCLCFQLQLKDGTAAHTADFQFFG
jgi:hypothetical protein